MATDLRRRSGTLDPSNFEPFYRGLRPEIFRFVMRDVKNWADAEEVTQTAFLEAYRALQRGDEPRHPRPWMYEIARNTARRRFRTQSRRPQEVELVPELVESLPTAEEPEDADGVRSAMASLRPRHRQVVFLREVEGLSYDEIAERMSLSHSAVETLLFRARRALREELEAEGVEPAAARRRFGSIVVVPAFLTRWLHRAHHLLGADAAVKAATGATIVALGTGAAVGIHAGRGASATREASPPTASGLVAPSARWSFGAHEAAALPAQPQRTKHRSGGATGHAGHGAGSPNHSGSQASPGGGPTGSGGVTLQVPGVDVPSATVPSATVPSVTVPSVTVPPVSTPPVVVVPPISTPPISTPPISTPPISTPPVSTPPVSLPPVTVPVDPDLPGLP
jgi:RNA polymerase sigma factor (sigma-70 family)